MNRFQQMLLQAQFATAAFISRAIPAPEDRENGQSSAEYAGIIIVAVLLVTVLIGAANGWGEQIGQLIEDKIGELG